jgi:hypothetical protein
VPELGGQPGWQADIANGCDWHLAAERYLRFGAVAIAYRKPCVTSA